MGFIRFESAAKEHDAAMTTDTEVHPQDLGLPPVQLPGAETGLSPLDEMDSEIAADWDLWSVQIGNALQPHLEGLVEGLPHGAAAMACTSDGFNLCAVGLKDPQVVRLSALISSLLSVAGASVDVLMEEFSEDGHPGRSLGAVSVAYGDKQGVIIVVRSLVIGSVVLFVTAPEATLGYLLVQARAAAQRITHLLGETPSDKPGGHESPSNPERIEHE